MTAPLLEVEGLSVRIHTRAGIVNAVDRISLSVNAGEIVGLVGESGSGKSMTALALMRLLPSAAVMSGEVHFDGNDLGELPANRMARLRGSAISMIFQDPLSYLNPVMRVGPQIAEAVRIHHATSRKNAEIRTIELLQMVGLPSPERVYRSYPHELSGGMRQRALIAMAIIASPKLLIADEPTTALDVTVQAQIMELLTDICRRLGTAMILITHDLGLVAEYCDRSYVIYAGRIVESANVYQLFESPNHPYTQGLLQSVLPVDRKIEEFRSIEGNVPQLIGTRSECLFRPRCNRAFARCAIEIPPMTESGAGRGVACWLHEARK
jgi:peptide/nickel transport system ATP-binding protein